MTTRLLHVATAEQWAHALRTGSHEVSTRGVSYADVGFVHCATPEQVEGVLARFYADVTDPLVLLEVDAARVADAGVEVRWEPAPPDGEVFPHVVAPLDPAWVVRVSHLPAPAAGSPGR